MKSRVIGDVFEHPTMGRLQVCEEPVFNECLGCVFSDTECCQNDPDHIHTGRCSSKERMDKTGVIFKKAKEVQS